jgi:uncharacterized membrane protein YeaQ/YmgE (transglycosylase-associated protein family)
MTFDMIVTWVVVGAVAGWLARQMVKGFQTGVVGTVLIGILGAMVGGWIVQWTDVVINLGNELLTSIATAFVGAVVLLVILRMLR